MSSRNSSFKPEREPFAHVNALELQGEHTTGPLSFLNPTTARFQHTGLTTQSEDGGEDTSAGDDSKEQPADTPASNVSFLWRSRDNRKGRHVMQIQPAASGTDAPYLTPAPSSSLKVIGRNIVRMFTFFPVWNISWLIAFIFTLGSVVWVINSFFAWLPLVDPSTSFPGELANGGGITAFLGAIVFFETGSILLFFEAINEHHDGCFGWAVEQLFEGDDEAKQSKFRIKPDKGRCSHHHQNRRNFVGKSSHKTASDAMPSNENSKDGKTWQWYPSWYALRTHYLHELGFLAGCAQITGATIFGISGFTALPGIQNNLTPNRLLNGVYWIPQIVGGSFFILSGSLYMLETQTHWYAPKFNVLGWHIGFWNTIGGIGFTLCGALGPASPYSSGATYQSSLATFWGSWAFLIGSSMQWYESVSQFSVEVMPADQKGGEDSSQPKSS